MPLDQVPATNHGDERREAEKGGVDKDIEDVIHKVKVGGKAVADRVLRPDKAQNDDEAEKGKEITEQSSVDKAHKTTKEIINSYIPKYRRILVPHDGTEISDKALAHAIYLSKISNAEIVILNIFGDIHEISPTTISAGEEPKPVENLGKIPAAGTEVTPITMSDKNLQVTIQGRLEHMIKERISLCKDAGVKNHVSYIIQTGNAVDRIIVLAKESNVDLIIMASDKIGSSIKGIMSSTRKVIDSVRIPVLVLNE